MKPYLSTLLSACFFLASLALNGQSQLTTHTLKLDNVERSVNASIGDVEWLAGRWIGEGFGGQIEEIWSPAAGGAMVATFRLLQDDEPSFYELCLLVEENNTLIYKVRHFNPDFKAWEEKEEYVSFPLIKIEGQTLYFQGLTYELVGDICHIYLAMKQKDGSHEEVHMTYQRASIDSSPSSIKEELDEVLTLINPVPVIVLGSYHMSNPGADMFLSLIHI